MGKEIGPRELQLRQQREAAYEAEQKRMRQQEARDVTLRALRYAATVAATKTGKSRKKK